MIVSIFVLHGFSKNFLEFFKVEVKHSKSVTVKLFFLPVTWGVDQKVSDFA